MTTYEEIEFTYGVINILTQKEEDKQRLEKKVERQKFEKIEKTKKGVGERNFSVF